MGDKFARLYQALFGKSLAEPETHEDVRNILSCIRTRNGFLDSEDEAQLQQSSAAVRQKLMFLAANSREVLAEYTKMISSQLYADPFHFLHELIQNADDASYHNAADADTPPCIAFRARERDLVVDLNEDGFTLADVIAICSTGRSSKAKNDATTGEKGFGFKSVFGIASKVHIQSGLWSFSFRHGRQEDGIGMVSPSWEQPNPLPDGVRTRFILTYAFDGDATLGDLCDHLERQPVTIVGFLRKITKIKISLENVLGRKKEIVFETLTTLKTGYERLAETIDGLRRVHCFRSWGGTVEDMPERTGRTSNNSRIILRFPVRNHDTCEPLIHLQGQYIFAYLPVHRVSQLPFIIQADFMLPASRQDVIDNLWNRKLREAVAKLFARCASRFARESGHASRYLWLRFFPTSPMAGFWENLSSSIKENLRHRKPFLARDGSLHEASEVRLVPSRFLHEGEPLLPAPAAEYSYLSQHYNATEHAALSDLGVQTLSSREMLNAVCDDAATISPQLHQIPLSDEWHDTYTKLLKALLDKKGTEKGFDIRATLRGCHIFPVRNGRELEWWSLHSRTVYFPVLIDSKSEDDRVRVLMPTDLDLPVVHPDAVTNASRKEVYHMLGVQHCPRDVLFRSIESAQNTGGSKQNDNLLAHLELLFWYSHKVTSTLKAGTEGLRYRRTSTLFFQSTRSFDAEQAVDLRGSDSKRNALLALHYQQSQMCSFIRGGKTWLQWLQKVAGIRWFPPLQSSDTAGQLHWTFENILKENPDRFVPLLQAHWSEEYADTCRFNSEITKAVKNALVPCIGGGKQKLMNTFFPTREILELARLYQVEDKMDILNLPDNQEGASLNDWPSLRDLTIASAVDLNFYRSMLSALANAEQATPLPVDLMTDIYQHVGSSASLNDQKDLQDLFTQQKLIWDTKCSLWRSISECVWNSKVSLTQKFVITSSYDAAAVQDLFKTLLDLGDSTVEDLTDELEQLRLSTPSRAPDDTSNRVVQIYKSLEEMAASTETKQHLRSEFKSQTLIYCKGQWYKSSGCVWHESVNVGDHIPIQAAFPSLQEFFVTVLGVSTVSDVFMMRELARAAANCKKNWNTIRRLMLDTSAMLTTESTAEKFAGSIEMLKTAKFLPCRTPNGDSDYLATTDDFFIPDDDTYTQRFRNHLHMLDFTYSEMNILHNLIRLLELEGRYLSRNVQRQTEEGDSSHEDDLTRRFRQCAYAISCCAVFHHSPLYFNHAVDMHNLLRQVDVCTSPDMQTTFSVMQGSTMVRVAANRVSLLIKNGLDSLQIILPRSKTDQVLCLRGELPKRLAKELHLLDANAVNQIYRFINETDMGTDELLDQEGIAHADEWLTKTERLPQASESVVSRPTTNAALISQNHDQGLPAETNDTVYVDHDEVEVFVSSGHHQRRQTWIPIPAEVNHRVEAPEYWRMLEHVRRQAVGVKWRNVPREQTTISTNDHIRFLQDLRSSRGNSIDSSRYPELFGSDQYANFRIGAAGELFAFEVLRSLLGNKFTWNNWPSKIRHYVRAHQDFEAISRWTQPETSDLTYTDDEDYDLEGDLNQRSIGDTFDDWLPKWLLGTASCFGSDEQGSCSLRNCTNCPAGDWDPLEWFFEVKTTIGPCETDFFMSQSQYSRMRKAGTADGTTRRQVYCIIRVYDLLKDTIGLRMYIDPWRFRGTKLEFNTTDKWRVKAS